MKEKNPQTQVELLKWMLEDIRKVTIRGVEHLTKEQLFAPPIEGEYPIGSYLMHLCEVDLGWLRTLSGIEQPEDIKKRAYYNAWYDVAKEDFNPPKQPPEVKEYFDVMSLTRKMFLDPVSSLKDSELDDVIIRKFKDKERRYTKKWIIYHILEHEAHTRGQIFMLIRKAGWNEK